MLTALDNRWDPMPDYMMEEIMTGVDSLGNKELLESRIRSYKHLRNLAYNELVGIYLRDTVNDGSADSLVALLQNEPDLSAQYNLVFHYLKDQDTTQLTSVLNAIPQNFTLSEALQQIHQRYVDYISILKAIKFYTLNDHYPDSSQLITLFSMADPSVDMPSVYARNLLIHLGWLDPDEIVYLPVTLNSAVNHVSPYEDINVPKTSYISIFPNPAGEYFIVEYHIDKTYAKAVLTIQDMNGKLICTISLKGQLNQTIVPTGSLNNGIYLVSLYVDSHRMDSRKITLLQ